MGGEDAEVSGCITFEDDKTNVRCTVDLDASAVGWVASLWKSKKGRKHDELQGILRRGDEVLDTLHGSWLTSLEWKRWGAGRKVWDAAKSDVSSQQPVKEPLPSDARYRDDLKALLEGNVDAAQENKSRLEQLQRADQALRVVGRKAGECC